MIVADDLAGTVGAAYWAILADWVKGTDGAADALLVMLLIALLTNGKGLTGSSLLKLVTDDALDCTVSTTLATLGADLTLVSVDAALMAIGAMAAVNGLLAVSAATAGAATLATEIACLATDLASLPTFLKKPP